MYSSSIIPLELCFSECYPNQKGNVVNILSITLIECIHVESITQMRYRRIGGRIFSGNVIWKLVHDADTSHTGILFHSMEPAEIRNVVGIKQKTELN